MLVFTTLTKEALPLVRYWTGDITSLTSGQCACGRTLVRMGRIKGYQTCSQERQSMNFITAP